MMYMDHETVLKLLPDRALNSHKGDYGKIFLLCGSRGYTGAAALAAMGALRTGAGLVYLAVPESIYEIEAVKLLEPIVIPLPDDGGTLSVNAATEISSCLQGKDAVLVGPGLGRSEGVYSAVKQVLESYNGPIAPTILTPHEGEFARLIGSTCQNRSADAIRLATDLGCIVLLKGYHTVITDGITTYINTTGNPGMAVGGCGDLLSGMIVSLLGQGIEPLKATACAAWLHGTAGDLCANTLGQYGMLPSDMVQMIPRLLK